MHDFFGLPTGRFGQAVQLSVGSPLENLGIPVVESSMATFEEILTIRSWFIAFYNNNFVCIHCQCTCHFSHEPSAKVHFNKRLSVEIKLESSR